MRHQAGSNIFAAGCHIEADRKETTKIQTSQAADVNRPNYQTTNQVGVEMTSPTNQESSKLFELPWEIRERIYEYYLSFDHDDFGDTLRPLHLYIEQGGYSKPIPPLMLTSKRAYRELHQRVHSDAVMRVHTAGWGDRRIGFAVHGKLRFERLRRLYVLVAMEYPNWNRWLGMLGEVTRRATNLNELVVDWEPRPSSGNTKI
ncbi:hypothetical protein CGCSCA4_v001284 [Colletotrichum siamense]|nr:hypothetical protein CGCSCA4_v001284 [Colletotrichum siamense]